MSVECESCAKTCGFLSYLLQIPTRHFVSYIIDTAASANPFVRMKSVRVSCVSPSHTHFRLLYHARHNLCLASQDCEQGREH